MWPYEVRTGPLRSPHGLFTGCLRPLTPYGGHKLIMHALKLYGPCTGRQNSYGAVRASWVDIRILFKTPLGQPGNSPYGGDVTGALLEITNASVTSDSWAPYGLLPGCSRAFFLIFCLPARWASRFCGDHQQDHQCLWFPSCYNVTHVFCPSLFVFCWE